MSETRLGPQAGECARRKCRTHSYAFLLDRPSCLRPGKDQDTSPHASVPDQLGGRQAPRPGLHSDVDHRDGRLPNRQDMAAFASDSAFAIDAPSELAFESASWIDEAAASAPAFAVTMVAASAAVFSAADTRRRLVSFR